VKTELRLHNVRHLTGLQGERHALELRHELPPSDEPEIAALLTAAGILAQRLC